MREGIIYYKPINFFSKKKREYTIGLYVENLPQRGNCSCCSKRNSSCNPNRSCRRILICYAVVYHFITTKLTFFRELENFCFIFANSSKFKVVRRINCLIIILPSFLFLNSLLFFTVKNSKFANKLFIQYKNTLF